MASYNLIQGSSFRDERGKLNFFNDFLMGEVLRMYEILPVDTYTIRAWQGHKHEKKWFYCNSGAFIVNLIKLDNFAAPSEDIVPKKFRLDAENPAILEISGGYATGFKAERENSQLMVFSNFSLEESKNDDFRYPVEQWKADW